MNAFLIELWSDLKEKRLWPVALLLVVALVAVPFVLAKPAEEVPAPAADATASVPPEDGSQVLPAELEAAKPLLQTSTLSDFSSKDPFKPLKTLRKIERAAGVETIPSAESPVPDSGGGGEDTGSTGGTTPGEVEEPKTVFTYQAVVELTTASGTRQRRVNRLGILPSDTNPLLVFLGVSADNTGEAVFLVDSTVNQAGEGTCRPSPTTCSFLSLTTEDDQDEHIFTADDGKEYSIKLLEIRRVEVKSAAAPRSPGKDPVAQVGSVTESVIPTDEVAATDPATVTDAVEEPAENPFAGFSFPLFADEEE
jgi:hypothetical protein